MANGTRILDDLNKRQSPAGRAHRAAQQGIRNPQARAELGGAERRAAAGPQPDRGLKRFVEQTRRVSGERGERANIRSRATANLERNPTTGMQGTQSAQGQGARTPPQGPRPVAQGRFVTPEQAAGGQRARMRFGTPNRSVGQRIMRGVRAAPGAARRAAGVGGAAGAASLLVNESNIEEGLRNTRGQAILNPTQMTLNAVVPEGLRDFARSLNPFTSDEEQGPREFQGENILPERLQEGARRVFGGEDASEGDIEVAPTTTTEVTTPETTQAGGQPASSGGLRRFQPQQDAQGRLGVRGPQGQGVGAESGLDEDEANRISDILNQPNPEPRTPNEVAMEESRRRMVGLQTQLSQMTGNREDLPRRRAELQAQLANEQALQQSLAGNVSAERQQDVASSANIEVANTQLREAMADNQLGPEERLEYENALVDSMGRNVASTLPGSYYNEDGEIDREKVDAIVRPIVRNGLPQSEQGRQAAIDLIGITANLAEHASDESRLGGATPIGALTSVLPSWVTGERNIRPATDIQRQAGHLAEFLSTIDTDNNTAMYQGEEVNLNSRFLGMWRGLPQQTKQAIVSFAERAGEDPDRIQELQRTLGVR